MTQLPGDITVPGPRALVKTAKQFWKDFSERALNTFWQGAVGVLIAAPPTTDWSTLKSVGAAAVVGGAGAILSMAKSLVVRRHGVVNSASAASKV